ncbi:hypothetical protein BaRGS_00004536 [Batillaria attramentaria]|uniref:Fucosyltransferase n=1 Tax=Batillaria attramentaria TaxID=370345 RepID=A0ABD0LXV3_9CAEN
MGSIKAAAFQSLLLFLLLGVVGILLTFHGNSASPQAVRGETERSQTEVSQYNEDASALAWDRNVLSVLDSNFGRNTAVMKSGIDSSRDMRERHISAQSNPDSPVLELGTSADREHATLLNFKSPYILPDSEVPYVANSDVAKHDRKSKEREQKTVVWFNADRFRAVLTFEMCPDHECKMLSPDKGLASADAVLFHGVDGREMPPPRSHPDQAFVMYDMESPMKVSHWYWADEWNGVFNWTWTYRRDSDIWEPLFYLAHNTGKIPTKSSLKELARKKTKAAAWFVSDCDVPSRREEYVRELQKYIHVDVFGECGNLTCSRKHRGECFDMLSRDYYFYLSFENAFCAEYVTEKFFFMFNEDVHVIPVVLGAADYDSVFPANTFINTASFSSPRDLARFLNALMADPDLYVWYLWRKAHFKNAGRGIQAAACNLCRRLHNVNGYRKSYPDIKAWRFEGQCRAPNYF